MRYAQVQLGAAILLKKTWGESFELSPRVEIIKTYYWIAGSATVACCVPFLRMTVV